MTTRITIANGSEIPGSFGSLRTARKKGTVRIREPRSPKETFNKSWGTLTALTGQDVILYSDADPEGYPCDIEIFGQTYKETRPGSGEYRKTESTRLVQVPQGIVAVLETREGTIEVEHPDFVVVGKMNEVYANSFDWVAQNLSFLD